MVKLDCNFCDNTGYTDDEEGLPTPCRYCDGDGFVYWNKDVDSLIDTIKRIRQQVFYTKKYSILDKKLYDYLDRETKNAIDKIGDVQEA